MGFTLNPIYGWILCIKIPFYPKIFYKIIAMKIDKNKEKLGYSIVMFAHNEEKNIEASIKSALSNTDSQLNNLYIIANGCSDNTVPLVKSLEDINPKLSLVEITLGDKCNAWNHYVHSIAAIQDAHFFVDADVNFTKQAFPKMLSSLLSDDNAHAVAGLPFSGRNIEYYRNMVIKKSCLFGNCYGVKHKFIQLAREKKFHLPIGLGWIDSAITKVINSDIGSQYITFPGRVIYDINSGYYFDSLSPFKLDDIKLYINRITRYKLGKLQEHFLEQLEFQDWPKDMKQINKEVLTALMSRELNVPFYLRHLVLKRIQRSI